jgi:hypothetical protein
MFPTFATSRLRQILAAKVWNYVVLEMAGKFSLKMPDFNIAFRWSFTCRKSTTCDQQLYFPSEGRRAEDFSSPWKIRRLWPGSNPRTWVPKARTLPVDHRSRCTVGYAYMNVFFVLMWGTHSWNLYKHFRYTRIRRMNTKSEWTTADIL